MNITGLSYAEIITISNNLKTYASNMEVNLNELKTLLNNVGDEGTWSGTAASETKATLDVLIKKFPEFYEAVNETSKYLAQVVANYQAVDAQIKSN